MIRKIGILGVSLCCLVSLTSCEKDFNDIGTGVVNNTKFNTNQLELEIKIEPKVIPRRDVRADNLGATISEYWLGVYNSKNYNTIKSSFISQIGMSTNLITADQKAAAEDGEVDSVYVLEHVALRLPYTATKKSNSDGTSYFVIDSILGNKELETSIKVLRNGTYLNNLDPGNPTETNSFMADQDYLEVETLNDDAGFTFIPSAIDTVYTITRHKVTDFNSGASETFESKERLSTKGPFLNIPLNMTRMRELFWDKFGDSEFTSIADFNNYFRGIIVKAEGADGSMVPLNLASGTDTPAIDFYYTITRFEKKDGNSDLVYKDTVPTKYSFPLNGIRNSKYDTIPGSNPVPNNSFILQGTAGHEAEITVLGVNLEKLKVSDPDNFILKYEDRDTNPQDGYLDLKELASIRDIANEEYGFLVNDASLTFYVNSVVNTDENILPQRLFVHTTEEEANPLEKGNPIHIADAYTEAATFGGNLVTTDDVPEKYTIRITDYISNLLDRTSTNFSPLVLKVYNPTDNPYFSGFLNTNVSSYNWNPRGVTLLNENNTTNGAKKAVLTITYSEKR